MTEDRTAASAGASAPNARPGPETEAATRWLDLEEQHAWRSFLFGVQSLMESFGNALEKAPGIGLTFPEYEILVRLSEASCEAVRMSGLADQVVHSRSRLTHTVSRLEARGLVERRRCSADGRGREALLTEAGLALLRRAAPVHVESVRRELLDVVGREDFLALGRILAKTLEDSELALHQPPAAASSTPEAAAASSTPEVAPYPRPDRAV